MFVRMQRLGHSVRWELCKHSVDVYEAIAVSVEKEDGSNNVTRWETRGSVGADSSPDNGRQNVVVVHLEFPVTHDLEPVDDGFDGGEGIKVGIRGEFLSTGNIVTLPIE